MKILVISSTALPHLRWAEMRYGGIEILNRDLAIELVNRGHKVSFAAHGKSEPIANAEFIPLTDVEDNIRSYFLYSSRLPDFDVIHVGNHLPPIYSRKDLPYVAVRYDPQEQRYESPMKNAICPSKYATERFKEMYQIGCRTVNFGVDPSHYYIGEKTERICHLGVAIPQKGAFEAMGIAKRTKHKIDFIAGELSPSVFGQELCSRSNGDDINVHYNCTNQDKANILSRAKALIFPTWQKEAWTLSIIEAMMSGTPVITYDQGAYPEIVTHGKTGFLCKDVWDMEKALNRLDELEDAETIQKEAIERFSIASMVDAYTPLYEQVDAGKSW